MKRFHDPYCFYRSQDSQKYKTVFITSSNFTAKNSRPTISYLLVYFGRTL